MLPVRNKDSHTNMNLCTTKILYQWISIDSSEKSMSERPQQFLKLSSQIAGIYLCFSSSTLLVFHKPQEYPHHFQKSHLKVQYVSGINLLTNVCNVCSVYNAGVSFAFISTFSHVSMCLYFGTLTLTATSNAALFVNV